jgi:hypothetical protein
VDQVRVHPRRFGQIQAAAVDPRQQQLDEVVFVAAQPNDAPAHHRYSARRASNERSPRRE